MVYAGRGWGKSLSSVFFGSAWRPPHNCRSTLLTAPGERQEGSGSAYWAGAIVNVRGAEIKAKARRLKPSLRAEAHATETVT